MPLVSLLNYKTLANSIATLGNDMKQRTILQIKNKTVTVMLDGVNSAVIIALLLRFAHILQCALRFSGI